MTDPPYLPFSLKDLWKDAAPEMLLVKQVTQARFDAAALSPMPKMFVGVDPAGKDGDKTSMVTMTQLADIKIIENQFLPDDAMVAFDATYKQAQEMLDRKVREAITGPLIAPGAAMMTATQVSLQDKANRVDAYQMLKDLDKWLIGDFSKYHLQQFSPSSKMVNTHSLRERHGSLDHVIQDQSRILEKVHDHARNLDPSTPPHLFRDSVGGEVAKDFLWGPKGEWTGFMRPSAMSDLRPRQIWDKVLFARDFVQFDRCRLTLHWITGWGEVVERAALEHLLNRTRMDERIEETLEREGLFPVLCFETPRDVINWHQWLSSARVRYGERRTAPMTEETWELLEMMWDLGFAQNIFEEWIKEMESGKFKFGYGMLRDGEDKFDPIGVLAEINAAEWTWDEDEGGWFVAGAGDAYTIAEAQVAQWLMLEGKETQIGAFTDWLTTLGDGVQDFRAVGEALRIAIGAISGYSDDYRAMFNTIRSRQTGGMRGVYDDPFGPRRARDQSSVLYREPFSQMEWV